MTTSNEYLNKNDNLLTFPDRKNDNYLLQKWNRISPPQKPPADDIAFQAGATDLFVPKIETPSPSDVNNFSIVTWNIENLFLKVPEKMPEKQMELTNEEQMKLTNTQLIDLGFIRTPIKPEKQQKAVAAGLKILNGDIVALQEVNDMEDLDNYQKKQLGKDAYPYSFLAEGNDGRGIDVALLSKFPIKKVYSYRDRTFPIPEQKEPGHFSRDLMEAIVQITPAFPIKIFVTHSKSQIGGTKADRQREGEAREIARIIKKHLDADPNALLALAGDFNDEPESPSIKLLKEGLVPLQDPTVREGMGKEPTHHNEKFGDSRFDYILVSPALMKLYNKGSATVMHTETTHAGSDHDPIKETFKVS